MKRYIFSYDPDFEPAMPVLEVAVTSPHSGEKTATVLALVDSGSDGTLIPIDLLDQISALSVEGGWLRGLWSERRRVKLYLVGLEIGPFHLHGIRAAGVPAGTDFILGRNALNQIRLTLNGVAEVIELDVE